MAVKKATPKKAPAKKKAPAVSVPEVDEQSQAVAPVEDGVSPDVSRENAPEPGPSIDESAPAAVEPEAAPEPKGKKGDKLSIVRETRLAWWCPWCDNSNASNLDECANCGGVKQGHAVFKS